MNTRADRRIKGANGRSASPIPARLDQCGECLMVPYYSHTSPCVSVAVCVLEKGHKGKHLTSVKYGSREW